MAKAERVSKILALLRSHRHGVTTERFLEHLGITRATFFRDLATLRDQLRHPIIFDKGHKPGVWRLDQHADPAVIRDELPGIVLSQGECYALLTLFRVFCQIDPGFLDEYIKPLGGLLKRLLDDRKYTTHQFSRKVAIKLGPIKKGKPHVIFQVSEALVRDRRLSLSIRNESELAIEREVSPQRVVLTAQGWQLDFLDHHDGKRHTIAMHEIIGAELLTNQAKLDLTV